MAMQYRSQGGAGRPRKLARRLLRTMPEAWALGTGRGRSRASGALVWLCAGRSGVKEKPYGENHTHHQQQELFVMVAARLATDKVLRAAIRGSHHRAGRRLGAGGNSLAL